MGIAVPSKTRSTRRLLIQRQIESLAEPHIREGWDLEVEAKVVGGETVNLVVVALPNGKYTLSAGTSV